MSPTETFGETCCVGVRPQPHPTRRRQVLDDGVTSMRMADFVQVLVAVAVFKLPAPFVPLSRPGPSGAGVPLTPAVGLHGSPLASRFPAADHLTFPRTATRTRSV